MYSFWDWTQVIFLFNIRLFTIVLNNYFCAGNVHIYYIKDFGAIDFNAINSNKLCPDSSTVISLNIMVNIEEYLIIGYHKKFYIVKFM